MNQLRKQRQIGQREIVELLLTSQSIISLVKLGQRNLPEDVFERYLDLVVAAIGKDSKVDETIIDEWGEMKWSHR